VTKKFETECCGKAVQHDEHGGVSPPGLNEFHECDRCGIILKVDRKRQGNTLGTLGALHTAVEPKVDLEQVTKDKRMPGVVVSALDGGGWVELAKLNHLCADCWRVVLDGVDQLLKIQSVRKVRLF